MTVPLRGGSLLPVGAHTLPAGTDSTFPPAPDRDQCRRSLGPESVQRAPGIPFLDAEVVLDPTQVRTPFAFLRIGPGALDGGSGESYGV